jgi:Skp family chaperone for outer membrane proteins
MIFHLLIALSFQLSTAAQVPTGVVNMPRLVAESMVGKAATAQLKAFQVEKQKVLSDKQAEVQRLAASRVATAQIEKAQLELQRLTQDAESELADFDRQLHEEWIDITSKVIERLDAASKEKK